MGTTSQKTLPRAQQEHPHDPRGDRQRCGQGEREAKADSGVRPASR